jgi:demethylmenaquinone methyltransferase/2-methoxy-6-polyprenyl-1,4-benzoquinol methylase
MDSELNSRKKESFKIFDDIASTYDFLNHLLSFGIDKRWRKKILKHLPLKNPIHALDLATGTGDLAMVLGFDKRINKVTGIDLSKNMVEIAKAKVVKKKLGHKVQFIIGDGQNIPSSDNCFDMATISFGIRNFSNPKAGLVDIYRVLKPGGRAMIMEFSIPKSPFFKAIYFFYFRYLLPFVGNIVSKHKDAYTYLNKTVEDFPYGDAFLQMMREAKFENLKAIPLTFGIATLYIGDKK